MWFQESDLLLKSLSGTKTKYLLHFSYVTKYRIRSSNWSLLSKPQWSNCQSYSSLSKRVGFYLLLRRCSDHIKNKITMKLCNIPFISSIILNMLSSATNFIAVAFLKSACLSAESVIIVIAQISGMYESNFGEHMANFPASTKVSVMSPNTFDKGHTYTRYHMQHMICFILPRCVSHI